MFSFDSRGKPWDEDALDEEMLDNPELAPRDDDGDLSEPDGDRSCFQCSRPAVGLRCWRCWADEVEEGGEA